MQFTPQQQQHLAATPAGGPCLDLTAWFDRLPQTPGEIGRRLCQDRARVFGPCDPESLAADVACGSPSGRVAIDELGVVRCDVVLAVPGAAAGGENVLLRTQLAEYRSFDPPEAHAWLHPSSASLALGYGDWFADGNAFRWSHPDGAAQMAPIYRGLAAWWSVLGREPGCRGLWLGHEGCDDSARELAEQRPGHLITEWLIAESGVWAAVERLDRRHAAIPLGEVLAADSDAKARG